MTNEEFAMRVLRATADGLCDAVRWNLGDDGRVSFYVLCNDEFAWGCADAEDLTPENIEAFEGAVRDAKEASPRYGTTYASTLFCSRVRGMRPQGACYPQDKALWPLFDACGPVREVGVGNPYAPGEYK